jgi:hypothetical protein
MTGRKSYGKMLKVFYFHRKDLTDEEDRRYGKAFAFRCGKYHKKR